MSKKKEATLLLVEDEAEIRDVLAQILSRHYTTVIAAEDGVVGLARFKEIAPDVVISDIKMPNMDGITMCEEIRKFDAHTPIVITTAFTDTDNFLNAIKARVSRFLIKPVDLMVLEETVDELLETVWQKKAADASRVLLEEYKKAIDAGTIVSKADLTGKITYANDAFCTVSGYSREELIGQPYSIVRHPATPKEVFIELWDTILQGKVWSGIIQNRHKDGGSYFTKSTISPILDTEGNVKEFISIREDITDLVRTQEELERIRYAQMNERIKTMLRQSQEEFFSLLPLPMAVIGIDDRIRSSNHRFTQLFDMYKDKELLEKLKQGTLSLKDIVPTNSAMHTSSLDWKLVIGELEGGEGMPVEICVGIESQTHFLSIAPFEQDEQLFYIITLSPCRGCLPHA